MSEVETIKVKDGKGGHYVINKSDFKKDKHEEYVDVSKDNKNDVKKKVVKKDKVKKDK